MKQEVDFVKCSPTQNMTVLVRTKHPVEEHLPIAARLMSYDSVHAEQVGFVGEPVMYPEAAAHLRMAGGEFCGNACMALAALLAAESGMSRGDDAVRIRLETSGTDELIDCQVRLVEGGYYCRIAMPVPEQIRRRTLRDNKQDWDAIELRYQDAIHLVMEVKQFSRTIREEAERIAIKIGADEPVSMIGILLYDAESGEMAPLIYVPLMDSLVWERGCGSGTASMGAYLAWTNRRSITADIRQPGGVIHVAAEYGQRGLGKVEIEGAVGIVAEGRAFIHA
ncbi:diaminopimelate epimerase [Paenibacillus wulumuqiensis]|uniref:diaminopimelate epimerase n=1 Tax=Paenibacillus wulumuqiensis TaxID=1567107 RepID=UPI00061A059B|nr:diaminopimelate epimerase [Paenibacillus wulumuqiensis]